MRRAAFLLFVVSAFLPRLAMAGQDPTSRAAPVGREVQDLIFFADSRPVYFRLHLYVDGKPFRDAWDEFMDSLFRYLDVDGDGVLSQAEIDRAPEPQFLLQLLRGNYLDPNTANRRRTAELAVQLIPGKVKRLGLAAYYRLSGVEPFLAFTRDQSAQAAGLTAALFAYLDRDGDGKLSRDELLAAAASLRKLDLNDDEVIDREEVLPSQPDDGRGMMAQRERVEVLSDESAFYLPTPQDAPTRLAYALLMRYDKDKNQKLSRSEIALEKPVFDLLDADHDGELDLAELGKLAKYQPPDLEVVVQLGGSPGSFEYVYLHNAQSQLVPLTRRISSGSLAVALGNVHVDLGAGAGPGTSFLAARQLLIQQFKASDVTKRGYLDRTQADQNPLLRPFFQSADRNGDGKLTLEELGAYLDLLDRGILSCTVLMITEHGRALFELLNVHHDGRLRQRELRSAWSMVEPWAKGDFLKREDLPQQFDLLFTQGQPGNVPGGGDLPAAANMMVSRRPGLPERGPLWFRKMDRNGDGVVTLREFLGTREDFKRIDTNSDGIITPEEAEAADALFRKQKGEKTP